MQNCRTKQYRTHCLKVMHPFAKYQNPMSEYILMFWPQKCPKESNFFYHKVKLNGHTMCDIVVSLYIFTTMMMSMSKDKKKSWLRQGCMRTRTRRRKSRTRRRRIRILLKQGSLLQRGDITR